MHLAPGVYFCLTNEYLYLRSGAFANRYSGFNGILYFNITSHLLDSANLRKDAFTGS